MNSTGTQSQNIDDAALMERISAGDENALEQLYDRYGALLSTICRQIVPDRAEAEEVLIDVFWEVWEKSDRYDLSRGSPRTYLTMLTRSRAIDRLRSIKSQPSPQSEPVEASWREPESQQPGPQQSLVTDEISNIVATAVANLPEIERRLIELSFFQGLTHRQIADRLTQPLGTIKSQIRRGIGRLRDTLRKFYEGGSQ